MPDNPNTPAEPAIKKIEVAEKFVKPEKIEKIEHKEKLEKFEHKEKIEKFEQLEKLPIENKLKDLVENQQPFNPGDPIDQRLTALEQSVASMQHFITAQQRPDLSRGALSAEPPAKKPGG